MPDLMTSLMDPAPAPPEARDGSLSDFVEIAELPAAPEPRTSARASAADRFVGARIRERRVLMGLSQQQLALMIGVTCQQAHKYERGLNRISAGRLYEIGIALGVPVSWFFEGLGTSPAYVEMNARQRMCLELARNFAAIENERHQEALSQLARALAEGPVVAQSPLPIGVVGEAARADA